VTGGPQQSTRERILDATLSVMAAQGLARLALEDVARAAGVSRQTVYRWFGSREALITAVILREEEVFIERISAAAGQHVDLRSSLEAAIAAALRTARAHPLLDRLLESEPEALLPVLVTSGGPVLSAARPAFAEVLSQRLPELDQEEVRRIADATTRLLISYVVDPAEDDPGVLAVVLADLLLDGIASREAKAPGNRP
jgi:AcrR family transcriptional regulator